jgi:hypothetical protein
MTEDPTIYVLDISDQTTYQQTGKRRNPTLKYRRRNREMFFRQQVQSNACSVTFKSNMCGSDQPP